MRNYQERVFPSELYNNLPCGYHSLDQKGNLVQINDIELQMLGYSRNELLGSQFAEVIVSESLPTFQQHLSWLQQRGWINDLKLQLHCKDGTILPVTLNARVIKNEATKNLVSNWIVIDISDRQQVELALRESEAKFEALVTNMPGMVYRYLPNAPDCPHHFTFVSQYSHQLLELAPEKIIQDVNAFINLIHPEDLPSFLASVAHAVKHFLPWQWEGRIITASGQLKWIQGNSQAQNTAEGEAWDGLLIDISDRKQTELALQQQIAQQKLIAEITQAIHQTLDVEKILQIAVERIRQFLKTDRVIIFRFHSDWSGRVVAESVTTASISILESEIRDPCFGEQCVEFYRQGGISTVADFNTPNIETCYQELMAQFQVRANLVVPILQREHLWGLLIVHSCWTPRSWLSEEIALLQQLSTQLGIAIQQTELYQSNSEQAALIDIASDGIFVRDLSNRILFWSRGAERMYGWTAAETKGKIAHELFDRESSSQLETALATTIEQGSWNGELKQLTKEEREIIVESRWTLMSDHAENPQSILVVNSDITEQKQLENQLFHAQRLESIGTLAGGIAHDLNNILTPILGFTELLPLKLPQLDRSSREILELIRDNTLRGSEIVKQVLLFSREIESEWELVNLAQVLEEVLRLIRETFPKSITIEDYISANLWQIDGDSTQLHQVFMNLCVNARDAMPDGGKLIISAENLCLDEQYSCTNAEIAVGNYILLTITDTGMGIPPEQIDRIFEPFFTTKKPGQGTGLGLSTVIGIVKNHGGTIEVKSDRRNGTQFQIYLPTSEVNAVPEIVTDETIFSGEQELILIVDDEASIREVTKVTLETHNYRVITASDGIEAIAIYAQQLQDIKLVFMDLTMPEMDGLTAMRTLKKINPQVNLIATSGLATKEKVTAAEAIGIQAFLVKPYTSEKLLLTFRQAIASKSYSYSL